MPGPRVTIQQVKTEDWRWKPGGTQFDDDSIKLSKLYTQTARTQTYAHLATLGQGDKDNRHPLVVGVIPRLTESLSVLYRVPATRRLKRGGKLLADSNPACKTFETIAERMCLDNVWQLVDARRNLFRQCMISFVESQTRESVAVRIVEPHSIWRMPTATAADDIEEDRAIALLIRDAVLQQDRRYQLWQHDDDDQARWRCWIVDGGGAMVGQQPYGEEGLLPFDCLPLLMVYDDLPAGQAYLPIPESRLDFAQNVNALANDLQYLVKLEAHTIKAVLTDDPKGVPSQVGPDKTWIMPRDADVKVLATSPHIADAGRTIEQMLSMLAMAESLPPDYFSATRVHRTGPALKTAERDLEARRQRQIPLAMQDERRAFHKIREIHNMFAGEWGQDPLPDDVELSASFLAQWQPVDPKDLQNAAGFDLAIGAMSMIEYIQQARNITRAEAIEAYEQVQADREAYPVLQQQNPAALLDGPNPLIGNAGATKTPGAFNPDLATSTDGASVADAVKAAVMDAPAMPS